MMRTMLAAAAAAGIALGVGFATAQEDPLAACKASIAGLSPIKARQTLMKCNGAQAKIAGAMAKGEMPFDIAKAHAIFAAFENTAAKAPDLFPENSKTGEDTAAKPEIWQKMADFKDKLAKFGADAKDADGKVKDLDSFKAEIGNIGKNDCGGCHETYRVKKS